jgi:hypothetical protein
MSASTVICERFGFGIVSSKKNILRCSQPEGNGVDSLEVLSVRPRLPAACVT